MTPRAYGAALLALLAGCAARQGGAGGPAGGATRDASAAQHAMDAAAPTESAWIVEQVEIEGSSVRAGRVQGVLRAPFEQLVATALDFAHYREFFPYLMESRVVQRRRDEVDVYLRLELRNNLGTLWSLTRFTVARRPGHVTIRGELVDGNLQRFDVEFEVEATQDSQVSLVTLTLLGVPPMTLPSFLMSSQQARWAERVLRAFARQVDARVRAQDAGAPG